MKNKVNCTNICVECVANDPVDIRCGGPKYLGFDFPVKDTELEEMKSFIYDTLEEAEVPIIRMYLGAKKELEENSIWTKPRIVKEINKDAAYLQSEAQRYYNKPFRR